MSDARTQSPAKMISAVEYSTTLESLLNYLVCVNSCLLLTCSSLDILGHENIIKRFLAMFRVLVSLVHILTLRHQH